MKHAATVVVALSLVVVVSPSRAAEPIDYRAKIQPILAKNCYECHGPDKQQGDLRLDSVAGAIKGGYSGPAIERGDSAASLIIEAVTHGDNASPMPPERDQLAASDIDLLKAWIDQGAKAPADDAPLVTARRQSDHWSFQPLAAVKPPKVKHRQWVRNPIDAFVLQKLEEAGLEPSPEADRVTLIRRASLDLLGLPPTLAEVDAFVKDTSPDAYEKMIERLLASPHYGERWGRHWLDQARYADSNGYGRDAARTIWKYRDWVIDALNRDQPFDEFTIEQIAGDMLPQATTDQIVATGFHRNTLKNEEGGVDEEQFRVESVVDRVSTTGTVFLGLTIGCARCHDHKFDPISAREFYQLYAFLNNADEPQLSVPSKYGERERPTVEAALKHAEEDLADVIANSDERQRTWEDKVRADIEKLQDSSEATRVLEILSPLWLALEIPPEKRTPEQAKLVADEFAKHDVERRPAEKKVKDLKEQFRQIEAKVTTTLVMQERKEPRESHIQLKGDFLRLGPKVEPEVPDVLPPLKIKDDHTPNRLDLARWLVDPQNPLTPRVTVNRVWQQYFGTGLVPTENDFGTQGEKPTHPELLDWLARRFIADGWKMKSLHRLIVTSNTYRQSSKARADLAKVDPYNKLLGRQVRQRLDAEIIRDVSLAASGLLSEDIGGPSVYPPQPEGIYKFAQGAKYWGESIGSQRYRRGMYTNFWRSAPYPFLITFDAPDSNTTCTRRPRSNTPLQSLTLANDAAFVEIAQALAGRVLREAPDQDDAARLRYAVRVALAREPNDAELERLEKFLVSQREAFSADKEAARAAIPASLSNDFSPAEAAAWTATARVLMNLDEFITRE